MTKNLNSFLNHMLYRPKRVVTMGFHFLAFGPTHRYDRATEQWTEGSDLSSFHGGTRELFVNCKDFVVYAGSYKCLDLSELKPMGTALPSQISPGEILDAALGVPRPKNYVKIIKKQFPDGAIKVGATALQYVGFNQTLYDALRRRFASDRATKGKRKASGEDLRDGGKLKVQKKF
ncbi:hypothetical protein DFH06DRAFT_974432 [Mycena polygramma]|nr:hypothetical protein DFH06DRAFT_974432 [Mycena polygramma]